MNILQASRVTLSASNHPMPGSPMPGSLRLPANGNRSAGAALRERLRAAIQAIERAGARRAGTRGGLGPLGLPAVEAGLAGGGPTPGGAHGGQGTIGDECAAAG